MLFEVITRANPIGLNGDEFIRRLPEGLAYMRTLRDKGIVRHSWIRVGQFGAVVIFDVDSHEQLLDALNGNPLVPHVTFDVTPLVPSSGFTGVEAGRPEAG